MANHSCVVRACCCAVIAAVLQWLSAPLGSTVFPPPGMQTLSGRGDFPFSRFPGAEKVQRAEQRAARGWPRHPSAGPALASASDDRYDEINRVVVFDITSLPLLFP